MSARLRGYLLGPGGVILLAGLVRLAFVLSMHNRAYYSDTLEYEAVARGMLRGQWLTDTPRSPLFPAEMALGFLLGGGVDYAAVRLVQVVLATVLVAVAMALATRIGGRSAGLLTGLALAFTPTLVFVSGMLYPTTLYALLLSCATLLALRLAERAAWTDAVGLGLLLALGWLTDPVVMAPSAALFVWLATRLRRSGARLAAAMSVTALVAALVVVPYARFAQAHAGGRVVFMDKAQYTLHYARTDPEVSSDRHVKLPPGTPYVPLSMGGFMRQELGLLRAQPVAYTHDVVVEFLHFFKPMPDRVQTRNEYSRRWVLLVGAIAFVPVLLLFVLGLLRGAGTPSQRWLLASVVLATAGFYSLFFTQTRYRVPVEPQMTVLAALALVRAVPALRRAPAVAATPAPGRA